MKVFLFLAVFAVPFFPLPLFRKPPLSLSTR